MATKIIPSCPYNIKPKAFGGDYNLIQVPVSEAASYVGNDATYTHTFCKRADADSFLVYSCAGEFLGKVDLDGTLYRAHKGSYFFGRDFGTVKKAMAYLATWRPERT